mgnify:CR=1 FL=1
MPPFKKPAPAPNAPKAEHKKHIEEFLLVEDHKDPKKVNKPEYRDLTDIPPEEPPEANPKPRSIKDLAL